MTGKDNGEVTLDDTRTALLNGYIRKTRIITTENGVDLEIREPTVAQRSRMLKAGGVSASSQDISDIGGMQTAAIIECCYHPGSGKPVFSWTDQATIDALPTHSWFDEVATACMEMMGGEPDTGKPSSETESVSTSSSSPTNSGELSAS